MADSSMADSSRDEHILPDQITDEGERTMIEEVDNNDCLVHDEDETVSTKDPDESTRYSIIGKTFDKPDAAYNFYNDYALSKGFGIRKHQLNRNRVTNEVYRRKYVCNKQGFKDMNDKRRSKDDVKRRSIKRTGCKAMMEVTLSKQGEWVIDKFNDEHNHPLYPPSEVLKQRSHSIFHRSSECRDIATSLSKAGLKQTEITKIANAFRSNEEDKLTRLQCSNIVNVDWKSNLGKECHEIIMHFQEKRGSDQDFYFAMDLSTDGTIKNVFWSDRRSRSSYCQFGDVVFYATCKMDKSNLSSLQFVSFLGVNNHGQPILFGAALLENESETTFTWLFKHFLKCMYECPPISIITYQDLAICKAISNVLPKTKHRFCAWNIQKHVLEHLHPLRSQYDDFHDTYIQWVKSQNVEDFESKWEELKEKYHIGDDTWLGNMYKFRHHWVKAYLKDTFFAGLTTSGRAESMYSYFDGFVNSKTILNDFVVQYNNAVSSRRDVEDQYFRTLNSKPTLHSDHPIETMAAECYTHNIYDIFKKEWKASLDCGHETLSKGSNIAKYRVGSLIGNKEKWKVVEYKVTSDFSASCSCAKFETCGILCKHVLYIMRKKLLTVIPANYILRRWTMKETYKVGSIEAGWSGTCDDATKEVTLLTLWSVRAKFNKVLEDGRDSLAKIEKIDAFLNELLEEQNRRKKSRVELNTNSSSTITFATQGDSKRRKASGHCKEK